MEITIDCPQRNKNAKKKNQISSGFEVIYTRSLVHSS